MVTLAVPWRQAFVPTVFAIRGLHPIKVLPPWNEISEPEGGYIPSVNALHDRALYDDEIIFASYLKDWRTRFDYALVVNADMPDDAGTFVPPPDMELVKDEGFAQLYRFNHAKALSSAATK
jgi:hypothetical protein